MKFTKENVMRLLKTHGGIALEEAIENLDDTPEKVVVPKFVAEFYEECEDATLEFLITQLEATHGRSELGEWYRSCRGRHRNGMANAQEVIAKMKLYGYEVEPEKLYCIPLPHLETAEGTKQYLTKSGAGNYFALSPCVRQKQRYTKDELAQVPEVYKPFAKLIEEDAND